MIELLKTIKIYVEKRKIEIEKVNFDILLNQDSTYIDKIIKADDDCNKLALIYLLSNENFNSEINKFKKDIIDYISNLNFTLNLSKYLLKYGIKVMTNKDVLAREDAKEIISLIINAKENYQVHYGVK